MAHFKKDGTLDKRYKSSQFHIGLTGDEEGNLLKNNMSSSSNYGNGGDGFSYSSTRSEPYNKRNFSNSMYPSSQRPYSNEDSINKRSSTYRNGDFRRSGAYRSRPPIDSEGNVNFDFMGSSSHSSDYPTSFSYRIEQDDDYIDNNPFTKSSGPTTFSKNTKSFSIGPSSLSAKSRSSFKLRTNSANSNQPANKISNSQSSNGLGKFKFASRANKEDNFDDDSQTFFTKNDGISDKRIGSSNKVTLTQRSTSDSLVSSNSNFNEPELLTDYEIKLNKDGSVNRDSRAVKNGDIYFKSDGSIDRRCNAYKQGKVILDLNDQIDRFRMNIKLPATQPFSSQKDPFSSIEPSSVSKSPYSVKPKDIKLKPPVQSFNSQNYDASKLRQSPFESTDSDYDDDEFSSEQQFKFKPKSTELKNKSNEKPKPKPKLKLAETKSKSIETIKSNTSSQPVKRKKTLSKPFYQKNRRTNSSTLINYSSIINKVNSNKFKTGKDSDSENSVNDENSDSENVNVNVEKNKKETENETENENENKKNIDDKSKGFKLDTTTIYLNAIICLFVLYFVILSFIPISNERNYLIKCPKNAICDVKIDGNNSYKYTINRCKENYMKLENGFIQICAPSQHPIIDAYLDTLKASSYISQINGNCLFQHKKIDKFHIIELFPKADVLLLNSDDDFLTYFNGDEFKSTVPQYNLMCRIYKNSFESMPLQTLLIVAVLIAALFITSKNSFFDNE